MDTAHVPGNNFEADETTALILPQRQEVCYERTLAEEIWALLRSATPISMGYLLQNSIQLFSIIIIGKLGALELSIVASGFMIATCTGWLVAVDGTTALIFTGSPDALGSKAFARNPKRPSLVGTLLNRCILVTAFCYIPVSLVWYFIGPLLVVCGQSHELAYGTQTFLRCLIPSGLGYIYFECLKKYLQYQNIQIPGTTILLFVAVLHIPLCWAVVHVCQLGLVGGTIATGAMYWLACLLTAAYIAFVYGNQAWVKPSRDVLKDLMPFTRHVVFGIIAVGAEWYAFETIAIAAGVMGAIPVAAQSILMTTENMLALLPFGLGVASTNRVGNFIGLGQKREARLASRAASWIALANGCLTMTILITLRVPISQMFSNDSAVTSLAVAVFPWCAAFQVVDGLQAANSGCLRAAGRADIAAAINLFAYYAIAIPIGLGTGFNCGWGLHGLWFGLATALAVVGIGECVLVNLVPWKKYIDCNNYNED